jgi:hypothetical protein
MKNIFGSALVAAIFLGGFLLTAGATEAQLSARSPFMPEGSAGGAAPTENAPLELRGIISSRSGDLFALYDPSKKQSMWVHLNESGSDFVVRAHDVNNETVTVDYQGRTLTLPLKTAKVETMAAGPNPAQYNNMRPGNAPFPAAVNTSPAEEARRLESVAAEVRRRRMLRQAAAQNGQPLPPVGAPPMPVQNSTNAIRR